MIVKIPQVNMIILMTAMYVPQEDTEKQTFKIHANIALLGHTIAMIMRPQIQYIMMPIQIVKYA